MTWHGFTSGLRALVRRPEVDQEIDDELAHYVQQATEANIRAGMAPVEAARAARARVGSRTAAHEEALSGRWEAGIESTITDIGYALRSLRQHRGFALAAILTMALGIGANTAMFSVVNAVMLRPLPWHDANRLALIWTNDVTRGLPREPTAFLTITDWQSSSRSFDDLAYYSTQRVAIMTGGPGSRGRSRSALVSANLFGMLGVSPAMGRTLSRTDESERAPVAVISHAFWQRWFNGRPDVLGQSLQLEGGAKEGLGTLTVIGVMPPDFYFPDRLTEIWTPSTTYWRFDQESTERFPTWARRWTAIGRLAPDVSINDARADMARVGQYLASVHTTSLADFPGFGTTVMSVLDSITGQNVQFTLWVLLGAVLLVLLVACVNVANLLLARGAARQHEFAVRRALGAARTRIVRQLLTESLLLSLTGGAIGLLLAVWGTKVLGIAATGFVPRIDEIGLDWRVLAFALGASILAGMGFGLAPAVRLSRADASDTLKGGGRSAGHVRLRRSRDVLVITEFALALTLLTGAGLLLRSLQQLQAVHPGFDPSQVLMTRIEFPTELPSAAGAQPASAKAQSRVAAAHQLLERVSSLPGVTSAGFSDDLFVNGQGNKSIVIPGKSAEAMGSGELNEGTLTPGFFPTLRVPIRRGRALTDADTDQKIRATWTVVPGDLPLVERQRAMPAEPSVVNEAFVRRFFPNEDPLGARFCINDVNKPYCYEIVGVAGDMHRQGLERRAIPEYYGPWIPSSNGRADLLVRTTTDPLSLATAVRNAVSAVLPGATVVTMSTADTQLGAFSALRRLQTSLLTGFALLALVLAAIGIFGVVHYTVAERSREIGVRVALGARPSSVMRLVLSQGMRTAVIGIVAGLAASLAVTRVLATYLFEVGSTDLVTFTAVPVILGLVAMTACALAGSRALKVDPVSALRDGSATRAR